MKKIQKFLKMLSILAVVGLTILPANFAFATGAGGKELTDREKAAFIVRDEWTSWVTAFTASLSELDKNATARIYDNMDYYDMQYRFTEKYKKVPEYLDEDGKPTQKLKDLIKEKRKELAGARRLDYLCFTSKQNGSKVRYTQSGTPNISMGYSTDGSSFVPWDGSELTLNSGESIYVVNKTNSLNSGSNFIQFVITTGNIELSGDISSLINFNDISTNGVYEYLFQDCTAITQAEELVLPHSMLSSRCYFYMFSGCSSLETAPKISATTAMANSCSFMFNECDSLKAAPEIYVTTLMGVGPLSSMFKGCDQLKTAPSTLPATQLTTSCYLGMFDGCVLLEKAPHIAATTLAQTCFKEMFKDCSSLNDISLAYKNLPTSAAVPERAFENWVSGVSDTGTFYCNANVAPSDYVFGASALPKDDSNKWTIVNPNVDYMTFTSRKNGSQVGYSLKNGLVRNNIYYSRDKQNWTNWDGSSITINDGEALYVWNRDSEFSKEYGSGYIVFDIPAASDVELSGDVMSLVNFGSLYEYCFSGIFSGNVVGSAGGDGLISAKNLKFPTTVVSNCYRDMFYCCDRLEKGPELPATTLASNCYNRMFYACPSLIEVKLGYTGAFSTSYFNNWMYNVTTVGTLYYNGVDDMNIGASAVPANWTVIPFTNINWTGVAATDWMAKIPNSRYLNNINIPGTHDSEMVHLWNSNSTIMAAGKEYARCQAEGVVGALDDGFRLFDLRIDGSDTSGTICHGSGTFKFVAKDSMDEEMYPNITFSDLFTTIGVKSFLDNHPNETMIMSFKVEDGDAANVVTAITNVVNAYPTYFYTGSTIPRLKDVRGKIVILSRIPSLGLGIQLNLPDKAGEVITIDGVGFYAEDHYDVNADTKKTHIDTAFNTTTANNIKIDGTKGTNGGLIFTSSNVALSATPRNISNTINPYIKGKTFTQGKLLGWIFSDFVDSALATKIYSTNP